MTSAKAKVIALGIVRRWCLGRAIPWVYYGLTSTVADLRNDMGDTVGRVSFDLRLDGMCAASQVPKIGERLQVEDKIFVVSEIRQQPLSGLIHVSALSSGV